MARRDAAEKAERNRDLAARWESGVSVKALQVLYGISQPRIRQILYQEGRCIKVENPHTRYGISIHCPRPASGAAA